MNIYKFGHFVLILSRDESGHVYWTLQQYGNLVGMGDAEDAFTAYDDALTRLEECGNKWGYGS